MTILAAPPTQATTRMQGVPPHPYFLDVLFIRWRIEDAPIFDDEPTVPRRSPYSVRHTIIGIGVGTFDVTMRLENGTPHSSFLEMKHLNRGKLLTIERSTNSGTIGVEIAASLRIASGNGQNTTQDTDATTYLSPRTCCLTLLGPIKR
jgi:hypothetical protein